MGEPLTSSFGPEVPRQIADMVVDVDPSFAADVFLKEALAGYDALALTPRAWQIAHALRRHLPDDYPAALAILVASLGPSLEDNALQGVAPFVYLPHVFFVAEYGLDHLEISLDAQHELTQRFTAEFSIRPYLVHHREETLARLHRWAVDDNVHVRRLVSEGTRPRLPWAAVLRDFVADPTPVIELLEQLKDDPELYVRRSVANNLHDISKDHPDLVVAICDRWARDADAARAWLVRHALRTLVKRGHPGALAILGFGESAELSVDEVTIEPPRPRIGEKVRIEVTLTNRGRPCSVLVDLRVHFVKARGVGAPKVFKIATADLAARGSIRLSKTIALNQQTTRTHYPGRHRIELLVNGEPLPIGHFDLDPAPAD